MVVLLIAVCAIETVLLVGFGLYAEFLELKQRAAHHGAAGPTTIDSTRR